MNKNISSLLFCSAFLGLGLFFGQCGDPGSQQDDRTNPDTMVDTFLPSTGSSASTDNAAPSMMPVGAQGIFIQHTGYAINFNTTYRIPNWTYYELEKANTYGKLKRTNNFRLDPQIDSIQSSQLTDYRYSGYDRGHMTPSANFSYDLQLMDDTYYLTNMCPQVHDFNSGIWLDLENQVTTWARRFGKVHVVTGPVLPKAGAQTKTIGSNKVLVPESFWKVIYCPSEHKGANDPMAIAVLMPHRNETDAAGNNQAVKLYVLSVDELESLTGYDFFSELPDEIETKIESQFDVNAWF